MLPFHYQHALYSLVQAKLSDNRDGQWGFTDPEINIHDEVVEWGLVGRPYRGNARDGT